MRDVALAAPLLLEGETAMRPAGSVTAAAYRALPEEQRARTAIVAQIYPLAAAVDVYGQREGAPPAYSPHRGYGYFAPPPESATSALWVGFDAPDALRGHFAGCSRQGVDELEVWLCTGRTEPWAQMWPALRSR